MMSRLLCLMALTFFFQGCTTAPQQQPHETDTLFNVTSTGRADNLGHRADPDYHYPQMVMAYPATEPGPHPSRGKPPVSATPEHLTQTEGYSSNLVWLDNYPPDETHRHQHRHDSKTRISKRPLGFLPPTPGTGAVGDTGSLGESSVDQGAPEHKTYQPTTFVQ